MLSVDVNHCKPRPSQKMPGFPLAFAESEYIMYTDAGAA
jgi:hypothetical protein